MRPPLVGFNNNVRHNGRIFHIQTEDSGVKHPHIVTHLFADGGRIIKTSRTDYSEHVGREDMASVVRALMKEQHKAMFIALRAGTLDDLLDVEQQAATGTEADESSSAAAPASKRPLSNPNLRKVVPSEPPGAASSAGSSPGKRAASGDSRRPLRAARRSRPPPGDGEQRRRYAASRPAAIFGEAAPRDNIFGDRVISEQSLDEVILSYLAEDLKGSQK